MPSITGIFTSVSSKSNSPLCRSSASSAAAPSGAAVKSWPSSPRARTTRLRMASSSSAIRILAIGLFRSGDRVLGIKEAHHDVAGVRRRRRETAAEFEAFAGTENAAARQRGPGVDFLPRGVACGEAQAWYFGWFVGGAHDCAFDDQIIPTIFGFLENPNILEFQIAQIDRQADRGKQRRGLRQV